MNSTSKKLEIVLADPVVTVNPADYVDQLFLKMDLDTANATYKWEINDIFAEMHCIQLGPAQLENATKMLSNLTLNWMEHRLMKKVLSQTSDYSETLQIDPGCAGVVVFTPDQGSMVSGFDGALHYRFSIDGKNTINRDIDVGRYINGTGLGIGRQVYNHMLQKWFGNVGKQLVHYDSLAYHTGKEHAIYPLVTPMVNRDMLVNFNLRTDGNNMATKEIYYLMVHPRQMVFKNGRMQQ